MTAADQYRALAADCEARAQRERIAAYRREWEYLAHSYKQLAQQAERCDNLRSVDGSQFLFA
jgi:hypothetical protein